MSTVTLQSSSNVGFDEGFYPRPTHTNDSYLDYYVGVHNGALAADNDNNADGTHKYCAPGIGHQAGYSVEDK